MLNHFNNAGMFIECLPVSLLLESNANLNLCFVVWNFLSFFSLSYNQECCSTGLIFPFQKKAHADRREGDSAVPSSGFFPTDMKGITASWSFLAETVVFRGRESLQGSSKYSFLDVIVEHKEVFVKTLAEFCIFIKLWNVIQGPPRCLSR